jgi:NAD(P)H dehydrogenase (quinone)
MAKISVIYFSKNGATAQLANAAIAGIEAVGCEVHLYEIKSHEIHEGRFVNINILPEITDSDAIIFASPTYMGGVAAQFKSFIDATGKVWSQQSWAGKFAAGITCGTALNGDQSSTLQYLSLFASQHGMLWVGLDTASGYNQNGLNRLGCQLGVVAQVIRHKVDLNDLKTSEYLGARVASLVKRNNF